METQKVSQIGVYTNEKVLKADSMLANLSVEGAYRVMTELHYLFDFIDFKTDITKYDLVILPDDVTLPGTEAQKINDYIKNGGKVLITDKSGMGHAMNKFLIDGIGVEFVSDAEFCPRYVNITESFMADTLPMDYVMY